jgi:hypothetical protein
MTRYPLRMIAEIRHAKEVRAVEVTGRDAWALCALFEAGQQGCTPMDAPAPRWSAYVFNLRRLGFDIETLHERHGGPYAGTHARYVLHGDVRLLPPHSASDAA